MAVSSKTAPDIASRTRNTLDIEQFSKIHPFVKANYIKPILQRGLQKTKPSTNANHGRAESPNRPHVPSALPEKPIHLRK
jgi:hypothetical protein